ncbi:hypothetical protein, partial [Liberiplasma polymorphum]|uniref:hypothetical protein n=1 Tax=Liberiplasma polymorphum TaxID=3374570 RepID=UPI003773B919
LVLYLFSGFIFFNLVFLWFKGKTLAYKKSDDKAFKINYFIYTTVNILFSVVIFDTLTRYYIDDFEAVPLTGMTPFVFITLLFIGAILISMFVYKKFHIKTKNYKTSLLRWLLMIILVVYSLYAYTTIVLSFIYYMLIR